MINTYITSGMQEKFNNLHTYLSAYRYLTRKLLKNPRKNNFSFTLAAYQAGTRLSRGRMRRNWTNEEWQRRMRAIV